MLAGAQLGSNAQLRAIELRRLVRSQIEFGNEGIKSPERALTGVGTFLSADRSVRE